MTSRETDAMWRLRGAEHYDREQALLKAGAQLNGLEWPRITLQDAEEQFEYVMPQRLYPMETCQLERFNIVVSPLQDFPDPLAAMMCWQDTEGLTDRLPEPVRKTAQVSDAKPALEGVFAMAGTGHKLGGWGA